MKNIPLLLATIIGTVVLVVGIAFFFSNQTQKAAEPSDPAKVLGQVRNVKGPDTAPVTIVEFSDLQCPACRAVQPLIKQALSQYGDQVRLVYRHYPLHSIHPYAQLAAQANEVAALEGKFWEYHDLLFEKQSEWAELGSLDEAKQRFADYAQTLQIDKAIFLEKIESDEIKDKVAADISDGNALGINSTPSIFVNNQKLTAPQELIPAIESQLQKKE